MIDRVTFEKTTYAPAPARFEAGTPMIIEVIGLHAAIDYVDAIGPEAIFAHESALAAQTREALRAINSITLLRPRKIGRHCLLFDGGGASARHRHHIG